MSWHLLRIQGSHLLLLSNAPPSCSLVFESRYVQSSASWGSDPGREAPRWPQLASWGLCEQIPTLDPLTGPVLITECWVKKRAWTFHLPSSQRFAAQLRYLYTLFTPHSFALNKVIISIFCTLHRVFQSLLLVNRASYLRTPLVNDSTCLLQADTGCFSLCLRGD